MKVFITRLLVCVMLLGLCLPASEGLAAPYHTSKDNSSGARVIVGGVDVGYGTGDIWNASGDCDGDIRGDKGNNRGSKTGQCFGFAKHCQHAAWGVDETSANVYGRIAVGGKTTRNMSYVNAGNGQTYTCTWREYLLNRAPVLRLTNHAVHVRTIPYAGATYGHSMIIIAADDNNVTIADANFVGKNEPENQVQIRTYTWDNFFALCDEYYSGIEYVTWWNGTGGVIEDGIPDGGGGGGGTTNNTVADYIVHIDSPAGAFSGSDNIEISGWIASRKDVSYAMAEVEGVMQYNLSLEHAADVKSAYPDYAYTKRFRGVIDKNLLTSNSTYSFRVWCGLSDGTVTNLTTSSFSVGNIAPAVKETIVHIDRPTGSYSGSNNIEITGWVISDQAVPYVMAQVDGVTQYNLSFSHDADVKAAYPSYATTVRFRGVIDVGKLSSNTDYHLTVWAGTADGNTTYAGSDFRMGNIYEENTTDFKFHVDSPRDLTFSGSGQVKVNGWIVAKAPITYVMCQLNRWNGSSFDGITQINMDTAEDASVLAANPGYAYARRFTAYIDAGWMQSNSEYQVYIWAGLGASGAQAHGTEGKFWTGSVSKATYTVSYNANGGTGAPGNQTKTWNTSMALSSAIPTRLGYSFLGWSDLSTAVVPKYSPGQTYTANAALKLYAVWQEAETISVAENKRDIPITVSMKNAGRSFVYMPPATSKYRFETSGDKDTWIRVRDASGNQVAYDDNSGTNNNAKIECLLTSGGTYYIETGIINSGTGYFGLHFTRSFPVNYNANGGTGVPSATQYRFYGQNLTLSSTKPTQTAKITFDSAGGSSVSEKQVSVPFDSWNTHPDNSGVSYEPAAVYSADSPATMYAIWDYPMYGTLPTPTRSGYVFDGWYDENGEPVLESTYMTGSITLTAGWLHDFSIFFDANGGIGAPESITLSPGTAVTIPDTQPTRFGYTFTGWNVAADGSGVGYFPGASFTPAEGMTLYADWEAAKQIKYGEDEYRTYECRFPERHFWYTFTPDATTGYFFRAAGEPDEKAVSVYSSSTTPVNHARYILEGSRVYAEYVLQAGKTYYVQLDIVGMVGEIGSLMVYKSYPVTYNFGSYTETDYCYDTQEDFRLRSSATRKHTFTLNENYTGGSSSTRTYSDTLNNWYASANLTGTSYTPGAKYQFTQAITLYPKWNKVSFGTLPTPVRSGYSFDGWYTASSGGTKITSSMLAADYVSASPTLYAHWTKDVTVTFNSNGGSQTFASVSVKPGSTVTLPTASRSGYTFDGWYTAQTGGTKVTAATTFSSDTTLWAHWTKIITYVTVTFNSNGGEQTFEAKTIEAGSTLTLPTVTRSGYTFDGWYTAQTGGNNVTSATTFSSNTTLWAHWTKKITHVTVTFDSNGGAQTFEPQIVEISSTVTLPTVTRSGYTFDGWYTARTGGTKVTTATTFSSDVTLWAHWIYGTWQTAPVMNEPSVTTTRVVISWKVTVPAEAYSVYELNTNGTRTFIAKVFGDTYVTVPNVTPGIHKYVVAPTQQNSNAVWQYGEYSEPVTVAFLGTKVMNLPAALTCVDAYAFDGDNAIYQVKFAGNKVTSIGDYAFRNCTNLMKITIPDSVTSFGIGVFDGCDYLTVYCSEGSAAQAYCEANRIPYSTSR